MSITINQRSSQTYTRARKSPIIPAQPQRAAANPASRSAAGLGDCE